MIVAKGALARQLSNDLRLHLCAVPGDVAAARYAARDRQPGHLPPDALSLARIRQAVPLMQPLGFEPALRLDTSEPVVLDDVVTWVRQRVHH